MRGLESLVRRCWNRNNFSFVNDSGFLTMTKHDSLFLVVACVLGLVGIARGDEAKLPADKTVPSADGALPSADGTFEREIKPLLSEYCYSCHADGANEGSMSFDDLAKQTDREQANQRWYKALRQLRSGLMPPSTESQPTAAQRAKLEKWVLEGALGQDPNSADPGKVTIRRLNRTEYRNTVRDLLGVDYDANTNFPADDSGHGFDNLADVLTVSPLLLEKYVDAATKIVATAVPTQRGVLREQVLSGAKFHLQGDPEKAASDAKAEPNAAPKTNQPGGDNRGLNIVRRGGAGRGLVEPPLEISYYTASDALGSLELEHDGDYQIKLEMSANENYVDNVFDLNKCEFAFSLDGEELLKREFVRQGGKDFTFTFARKLAPGQHQFKVSVRPLSKTEQVRKLRLRLKSVTLVGPDNPALLVKPRDYDRFFPKDIPAGAAGQRVYERELLSAFATRAYRRPADEPTVERLVALAQRFASEPGQSFESGIAKAMTAVLASPRFVFREERVIPTPDAKYPLVDEYALASRLSYFPWSTMPDEELLRLAAAGKLREKLAAQVTRMLADERRQALVENFTGQWLQARAVQSIQINARAVLRRESGDTQGDQQLRRYFELYRLEERTPSEAAEFAELGKAFGTERRHGTRIELTDSLRRAMRRETELLFEHIMTKDRSVLEFLDGKYTFLNEALAGFYQIEGVKREEMRLLELPEDSVRGGVLTQGTMLVVTSNPDRTSPVKRGQFILENLLGTPIPAPPPDIPPLEEAAKNAEEGRQLSLRESLAIHRENAVCSSCHNRMDPLGLALENFNALGRFREKELGQPIDPAGKLATGEAFASIRELKQILVRDRKQDFYRCLTEKLMTYALGREVGYHDIITIDKIVGELEASGGKSSALIYGIIQADAFQRARPEK